MILLEHGPGDRAALFSAPREVIAAHEPREVAQALAKAEAARAAGAWIAGYVAYEAGYALEPKLRRLLPRKRPGPLLALGVFEGPRDAGPVLERAAAEGRLTRMTAPEPMIGGRAYGNAARKVFDYIAAGDCYQVNLTFPLESCLERGSPLALYHALAARQPVGFGAYADLGHGPVVVSRSPELFVRLDAEGRIQDTNPGATRILRAPMAAYEGRPLSEVPGLADFAAAVSCSAIASARLNERVWHTGAHMCARVLSAVLV